LQSEQQILLCLFEQAAALYVLAASPGQVQRLAAFSSFTLLASYPHITPSTLHFKAFLFRDDPLHQLFLLSLFRTTHSL